MTDIRARNRRKREVRATTERVDHSATQFVRTPRALPMHRSECVDGPRPCPYVSCRYNLYLDVSPAGNVKLNFPDLEPDEMPPLGSCALDIASTGGVNLDKTAELLNVTRERARQIEIEAITKLRDAPGSEQLEEHHGETIGPGRGVRKVYVEELSADMAPPVMTVFEAGLTQAVSAQDSGQYVYPPRDVDRPQLWELRVDASVQSSRLAALKGLML